MQRMQSHQQAVQSPVYSQSGGTPGWKMPVQGWGEAPMVRSIALVAMAVPLRPAGRGSPPEEDRLASWKHILEFNNY